MAVTVLFSPRAEGIPQGGAMKITWRAVFVAILLIAVFKWLGGAQNQPQAAARYDPAHQQLVTGIIVDVKDYPCPVSAAIGTHLAVKTVMETLEVHLAPAVFLKEYGIVFHAGDKVQIRGVRVTLNGKPAMLAREVTARNETFTFRDEKGRPMW